MIDLGGVDNLILAAATFILTFVVLIIIWAAFVRALFSAFGKTKFYFIPKTLKELFLSVAFVFLLISAAAGAFYIDNSILSEDFLKIWEILIIFAIANILVRIILTGIDVHQRKTRDRSGIYRSVGLLKGTAGIILYLIAILISIQIISPMLGQFVTLVALVILILFFVAGFDQIKSIVAGLQLGDYYVDMGSLITIDGRTGFVDTIHGRSTLLKTIDGKTIVIPNSHFFNTTFEIDPEDISVIEIVAQIKSKEPGKVKEKVSSISSKITMALEDLPNEYKPRILHSGVEEGKHTFTISCKITSNSDLRKIMDRFCSELSSEFKEKLVSVRMEIA